MDIKDKSSFINSFNNAIRGIIYTIKTQRNMRVHIFLASIVLIASFAFSITRVEFIIVLLAISLVISLELVNTAIESVVDLACSEKNEIAKIAKDVSAGAVLFSAMVSALVAYFIFFDRIINLLFSIRYLSIISNRIAHSSLLAIIIVTLIVLILKAIINKGTPLEGGMPSGHSAIGASLCCIGLFISKDIRIDILVILMFIIICQSRIKSGIHSISEVIVGSMIGFSLTYIMMLFR